MKMFFFVVSGLVVYLASSVSYAQTAIVEREVEPGADPAFSGFIAGTCASPQHDADCSLCSTKALCVSCCSGRHPGTGSQDKIDRDNCEAAAACDTIKDPSNAGGGTRL